MTPPPPVEFPRLEPLRRVLLDLAARPVLLWALALFGNAAWMPYVGIKHDAFLYAAQVLNALDGRLSGDLFFAYGSQSKYTLFPLLLAKLYAVVGIDWAFFLGYLASSALLIAGMVTFLRVLIGPTAVLPLAVLWCACTPIECAAGTTFHVNETFLTARPLAAALGLFALAALLAGRWTAFGLLTAAALVVHPLLGAPVALIGVAYAVARTPRLGWPAVAALTVAGFAALAVPKLRAAAFGPLDAAWRDQVIVAMPFHDPANWDATDWVRLASGAGFGLAFASLARRSRGGAMVATAVLVAAAGIALTAFAAHGDARLLFQGQPYRWVWVLEVLRGPLALSVVARLWPAAGGPSRLGLVPAGAVAAGLPVAEPRVLFPALAAGLALGVLTLRRHPTRPGLAGGVAAAAALLVADALHLAEFVRAKQSFQWDYSLELEVRVQAWLDQVGPLPRVASALALGPLALRMRARAATLALVAAAVAAQGAVWSASGSAWAQVEFDITTPDRRFVEEYVRDHRAAGERVTVYMPGVRPKWVWCDLDCDCYFMPFQVSGITFTEAGAAECSRRARLVAPFEVSRAREQHDAAWHIRLTLPGENFYAAKWDDPPPTRADFDALAAEPVDVVVLRQEFPGYAATNGRVYLYDLRPGRAGPAASAGR